MKRYLFLDVDGVLNNHRWSMARSGQPHEPDRVFDNQIDPACVFVLRELVDALEAEVVLSSTWRGHTRTEAALARAGVPDWIGRTPQLDSRVRGHEIAYWMRENGVTADQVVILDDDDDMAHLLPRLVQTDAEFGLVAHDFVQVLALFGL